MSDLCKCRALLSSLSFFVPVHGAVYAGSVSGIFAKKLLIAFYSLTPDLCDSGMRRVWESEWEKTYKVLEVWVQEREDIYFIHLFPLT